MYTCTNAGTPAVPASSGPCPNDHTGRERERAEQYNSGLRSASYPMPTGLEVVTVPVATYLHARYEINQRMNGC